MSCRQLMSWCRVSISSLVVSKWLTWKPNGGAHCAGCWSAKKHPNADRLQAWLKIDDGGVADVPRDDNGYVQEWFAVRRNVSCWYVDNLVAAKKYSSQQVLMTLSRSCWMRDRCVEILNARACWRRLTKLAVVRITRSIEINERDIPAGVTLQAGASFAEVFGLVDYVLEVRIRCLHIEPDCFRQLGIVNCWYFHQRFTSPDWYNAIQGIRR